MLKLLPRIEMGYLILTLVKVVSEIRSYPEIPFI